MDQSRSRVSNIAFTTRGAPASAATPIQSRSDIQIRREGVIPRYSVIGTAQIILSEQALTKQNAIQKKADTPFYEAGRTILYEPQFGHHLRGGRGCAQARSRFQRPDRKGLIGAKLQRILPWEDQSPKRNQPADLHSRNK